MVLLINGESFSPCSGWWCLFHAALSGTVEPLADVILLGGMAGRGVRAGRSPLTLTFRTLAVNHRDVVIECNRFKCPDSKKLRLGNIFYIESSLLITHVIRLLLQDKMLSLTPRENKVIETIGLPGVGHGKG